MTGLAIDPAVDELVGAIQALDGQQLHSKSRDMLKRLQGSLGFVGDLHRGIDAPAADRTSPLTLQVKSKDVAGNAVIETVGHVVRNPPDPLVDTRQSALMLVLRDLEHEAAVLDALGGELQTKAPATTEGEAAQPPAGESQGNDIPAGDVAQPAKPTGT